MSEATFTRTQMKFAFIMAWKCAFERTYRYAYLKKHLNTYL